MADLARQFLIQTYTVILQIHFLLENSNSKVKFKLLFENFDNQQLILYEIQSSPNSSLFTNSVIYMLKTINSVIIKFY